MFLKNYFASDVNSSKCLHAMSSNAHFCTHSIDDVIYHIFSHGDVPIRFYGKNVNVILELYFISLQKNSNDLIFLNQLNITRNEHLQNIIVRYFY